MDTLKLVEMPVALPPSEYLFSKLSCFIEKQLKRIVHDKLSEFDALRSKNHHAQ